MSYDRQLEQLCTHIVVEELLLVGEDRTTVTPLRPISAANSVVVRLNGEIEVPSSGVDVAAKAVGSREGPFVITASNQTFAVSVNGGQVQTATLPLSARMPALQAADLLNRQLRGLTFTEDRGFLRFETDLSGEDATAYVLPSSTLAATIGIRANREYRGRRTVPGWTLVNDPHTLLDRPTRLIVFDEPLKGYQDFVEVNYATVRQECRRCGGIGVESDWRYGSDGNVVEVRDEALLIQELKKIVFTSIGSNPFHPWYGSKITSVVGSKNGGSAFVQTMIVSDIQQTFQRWQSIKTQQEQQVGQIVSDEEFPFRLGQVGVEQSQSDPTVLFVNVEVYNRSSRPIQLTRGIRLPHPLNLLGDTQAQSLARESLRDFKLVK